MEGCPDTGVRWHCYFTFFGVCTMKGYEIRRIENGYLLTYYSGGIGDFIEVYFVELSPALDYIEQREDDLDGHE